VTDRSLLPAVEQKIIVNVTISPSADVTDEKLVQGIGKQSRSDRAEHSENPGASTRHAQRNRRRLVEELVFPSTATIPPTTADWQIDPCHSGHRLAPFSPRAGAGVAGAAF